MADIGRERTADEQRAADEAPMADVASALFPPDWSASVERCALQRQKAVETVELLRVIQPSQQPVEQQLAAVAKLFAADSAREQPWIDFNLQGSDSGETLAMLLARLRGKWASLPKHTEKQLKVRALADASFQSVLPHFWRLLSDYDVHLRNKQGEHALHVLLAVLRPGGPHGWPFQLAKHLVQQGIDLNEPDATGTPPLLGWVREANSELAFGVRLLLQQGADVNATDQKGDTLLHRLVRLGKLSLIQQLYKERLLGGLDFFQPNQEGQSGVDLAQILSAQTPEDDRLSETVELLLQQQAIWRQMERPLLLSALSHSLLIPDVAELVLDYVDGGGKPFPQLGEKKDADAAK